MSKNESKPKTSGEQKTHIVLSYIFNLVAFAFVLASDDQMQNEMTTLIYIVLGIIYPIYSYFAGKFNGRIYKAIIPQRKWLTQSKFLHHVNKIFLLVISAGIFVIIGLAVAAALV